MEKKKLKSIMTPCGRMYMNPDVYGYENEKDKATVSRKRRQDGDNEQA